VAIEPVVTEQDAPETAPAVDIRRVRPALFHPTPLKAALRRLLSVTALVVIDLVSVAIAVYLGLVLKEVYQGRSPLWGILWQAERDWMPFIWLITVLVFWRNGLYATREARSGIGRVVSSLVLVTVVTFVFAVGTGHHFSTFMIFPTVLVLAILLDGSLRASYDVLTRDIFRIAGVRRRAALVGEGERIVDLHRMLGSSRGGIEYDFVAEVPPTPEAVAALLGGNGDGTRLDELVIAYEEVDERVLAEIVDEAHRRGVKVRVAPRPASLIVDHAEYVPGQGVPLFEVRPAAFTGADWAVKRAFDLVVSAGVVVIGLPLWLLIAAAIKLSSPGPVFYRDRRVGLQEHEFPMCKFRTMVQGAAAEQAALEAANEADGPLFKIKHDPRVTRVGALLRRLSLDEVPQVLNVLRGEMSLVGPRPLPLRDYVQLEEWHRRRYQVLPGMTGLWQVSGRISLSFDELVRLDFYYIENWSIWLDITILLKTIPAVLARRGAY